MYGDVGSIRTICNSAVGEPALVSDVALALGEFSFRAAVPELTECLKSQWPKIREQVVTNLSEIGDQRALPFLIDALSDSSADVSYSAASALYAITNEMPVCARSDFPTQQASYVRHWSLWASNHKRSLDQLRSLVQRQLNDADSNAAR
jgi:HEAT repeat protein